MRRPSTPTVHDVAREAKVSVGTVSRVINRHETVRPEIRRRVEAAITKIGYTPNVMARSMRSRTTQTVGCMIREISLPGLAQFVQVAADALHAAGYALVLTSTDGRRDREAELVTLLQRRQADGMIIAQYSERDKELERLLRDSDIPIVLFEREFPSWAESVTVDHRTAIRRATEYLLSLGHRRIALVTGEDTLYPARQRLLGYEDAFKARDIVIDKDLECLGGFRADYGFERSSSLLASSNPPTAIIAGGMAMLPGVLRAIRVRGLVVPRDISVIGCGESELAELSTPSVSIERWDMGEAGRLAVSLLLDRMLGRGPADARHVRIPAEFVIRESCAPPKYLE